MTGKKLLEKRKFQLLPTQIIALVFIGLILFGTLLLSLPIASRDGVSVGFLGALLALTGAAVGCYFGVKFLRYLSVKAGFSGFAFYCWGAALFAFVMYLTVV